MTTRLRNIDDFAMANTEDSFTQRILRRASLKRQSDSNANLNSSKELSQRRYKILKAINEPLSRRRSCIGINENRQFNQNCDFSRDSFNLTGISCNNNNDENSINANKTIDKDFEKLKSKHKKLFELENENSFEKLINQVDLMARNLAQPEDYSTGNLLINKDNLKIETEPLAKMVKYNINSSPKVAAELNDKKYYSVNSAFDFGFTKKTESLKTPILPAIDDSDPETEMQDLKTKNTFTTEAVIEMCNRVYTALDVNCDSSDFQKFRINENTAAKNSKNSVKNPNCLGKLIKSETEDSKLEFTEKLSHSDAKKTLFPTISDVSSTGTTLSDKKLNDSEKRREITSILNKMLIKSKTEASTLKSNKKLSHSDTKKTLFPTISDVSSTGTTLSDKKADDSEKRREIASIQNKMLINSEMEASTLKSNKKLSDSDAKKMLFPTISDVFSTRTTLSDKKFNDSEKRREIASIRNEMLINSETEASTLEYNEKLSHSYPKKTLFSTISDVSSTETTLSDKKSNDSEKTREIALMLNKMLINSETEASTLEYTNKLSHSDPKKTLFSTVSDISSTGTTLSDKNSDDSEKSLQIASTLNDTSPYDEEKFLVDALGDELYNLSVTYDDTYARNRTRSDFTASDLISEDKFPLQTKIMQALNLPANEQSSPKCSSTLNRSMRIYRSLSQSIKKKFRPVLKPKMDTHPSPTIPSGSEEIDMIQDLLQEVKLQQTWMNQAAKVLHSCDWKKTPLSSSERVESERLLLVANLRRKAALESIKGITSDESIKGSRSFREKGEVTISNIRLHLRDIFSSESRDSQMIEWFVVTVTHGFNVWATPAIRSGTNEKILKFYESISIPNLTPEFKIIVEIHSLRLMKENFREETHRISKQSRSTSCLPYSNILASPTKLFKKIESSESPSFNDHNAWKSRNSSFVFSGFIELFLEDLSSSSPWSLMLVPTNSSLSGAVDLNLACRVHVAITHEGFLNFYEDIGGFAAWNRRWCVLKGHNLMFWNYPREQDVKEALKIIELVACVSNEITTVDRTICAKPRTLLIETERSRIASDRNSMTFECTSTSTFVRNLLSFDSVQDLNEWSEKLNHVLLALEEWHIIGQRTQLQVSEL